MHLVDSPLRESDDKIWIDSTLGIPMDSHGSNPQSIKARIESPIQSSTTPGVGLLGATAQPQWIQTWAVSLSPKYPNHVAGFTQSQIVYCFFQGVKKKTVRPPWFFQQEPGLTINLDRTSLIKRRAAAAAPTTNAKNSQTIENNDAEVQTKKLKSIM